MTRKDVQSLGISRKNTKLKTALPENIDIEDKCKYTLLIKVKGRVCGIVR